MKGNLLASFCRLAENARVPMGVVLPEQYEVIAASPAFESMASRPLAGVFLADAYAHAGDLIALLDSAANGVGSACEFSCAIFSSQDRFRRAGASVICEWSATPVCDSAGKVCAMLLVATDVNNVLETAKRIEMLEGLVSLSKRVSTAEEGSAVSGILTADIGRMLECRACAILALERSATRNPRQRVLQMLDPAYGLETDFSDFLLDMEAGTWSWKVIMEGTIFATEDVSSEADESDFGRLFRCLGAQNGAAIPMRLRGQTISILIVLDKADGFTGHDLELAEVFAAEAALAVENARLFSEQCRVATTLQEALLPGPVPVIPGFELATLYRPAGASGSVGGDFYDVFEMRFQEESYALLLGDVSGKGPGAAAQTSLVRHMARGLACNQVHPGPIVAELNRAVYEQGSLEGFITMLFGVIDLDTRLLRWANAGHPRPLLWRRGEAAQQLGSSGLALGISKHADLRLDRMKFAPGDVFVLFTDGLTEARRSGGEMLGIRPLLRTLEGIAEYPVGEIADSLYNRAVAHCGNLGDDVALIVLKCLL